MQLVVVTIALIVGFTFILALLDESPVGCLFILLIGVGVFSLGIECWIAAFPSIGEWNYGAQGFAALTAIVFAIGGMLALSEIASDLARFMYHKN